MTLDEVLSSVFEYFALVFCAYSVYIVALARSSVGNGMGFFFEFRLLACTARTVE